MATGVGGDDVDVGHDGSSSESLGTQSEPERDTSTESPLPPPPPPVLPPPVSQPPVSQPVRGGVRSVFGAFAVAAAGSIAASTVAAVLIAVAIAVGGGDVGSIQRRLTSDPLLFIGMTAPAQLWILTTALVYARLSRRPMRLELGWLRPSLSRAGWFAILIGSGVPFGASIGAASLMPSMGGSEGLPELWRDMTLPAAVAWVLFIGAVPGLTEELFFRGLLQRRLLQRWKAPTAIGVTSVLFALLHIDPPAMALALVLGVWLGVIAWRTGSIWPGMAVHASINGSWNLAQIVVRKSELDERAVWIGVGALGAVSLVAFIVAVRVLARTTPPEWCSSRS